MLPVIFLYKQKRREDIGSLKRLPKNAVNYFVLSLPAIIFTITIIIYNYNYNIIIIHNNNDEIFQDPILLLRISMITP
jgi:hypothetical protein